MKVPSLSMLGPMQQRPGDTTAERQRINEVERVKPASTPAKRAGTQRA